METNAYNQKLNRYVLNDQIVYTGFSSFNDADECARKKVELLWKWALRTETTTLKSLMKQV